MSSVILAEKPSQAKSYADAFNHTSKQDGYIEVNDNRFFNDTAYITWGFGHLVEMQPPENYQGSWKQWSLKQLPMIPEQYFYQISNNGKKQFNIVKQLLTKSSHIIVATDADREGENIARSIIEQAGANEKPVQRLWINSLETKEIQDGFKNLKKGSDYYPLYVEAKTRQISDWLVGMNASRLYTLLLQQKGMKGVFSVGRVQTATLYLLYTRQREIENFTSEIFFEIVGKVKVQNGVFNVKNKDRYNDQDEIKQLLNQNQINIGENNGVIKDVKKENKQQKSPKLHSLSSLQGVANKKWKYSPSETLKIVQSLYEKKLLSYPRTDCSYITENEFAYLKERISDYQKCIRKTFDIVYPDARKRYVDGTKVQEHYAIIPTKQVASIERLNDKEKHIYQEVIATTLAMFASDYEFEETKVEVDVNSLLFEAKGKVETNKGWKDLFPKNVDKKEKEGEENVLPAMTEGESCSIDINTKEGKTKPPKYYTEGQLINVMKHAGKDIDDESLQETLKQTEGIGTEATRASIIDTLKRQKYIDVKKNKVMVTDKGEILSKAVEGTLLSSPEMTAKWESYLAKIGKKEGSQNTFISKIEQMIQSLIDRAPEHIKEMESVVSDAVAKNAIGNCPVCEGQIEDKGRFYGCNRYREGCTFTLPKNFLGKAITQPNIKKILNDERTNIIKGFKSKKKSGKVFDAYLYYDKDEKRLKPLFK